MLLDDAPTLHADPLRRAAGDGRLSRLAALVVRRPRAALALWGTVVLVLGALGAQVKDELALTRIAIPGTESAHEVDLAAATFGRAATFPVMLHGPRAAVDRGGPRLVQRLRGRDGVRVVSPFDTADGAGPLRPRPQDALVVLSWPLGAGEQAYDVVDDVRATVARATPPPLRTEVGGATVIGRGLNDASYEAVARAELIAAPMLLLVLLLLFRTPVAAAIPLIVGGATVACGNGIIALLARVVELDVLSATAGALLGLALGVDYSLLMVARFREVRAELGDATAARHAVLTATSAGRTVLAAGVVLVAAMAIGLVLSPGPVIVSAAVGTIAVGSVAVVSAIVAVPALLVLFAGSLDRWPIGRRARRGAPVHGAGASGIVAVARAAQRRPLRYGALAAAPLVALTAVGLTLDGGAPTWRQLPQGNEVRAGVERLSALYGTGWEAPLEIVVTAADGRPITEAGTLRTLERLESRIAKDEGVALVAGPAEVGAALRRLRELPKVLEAIGGDGGRGARDLRGIATRLDAARGSLDGLDGQLASAVAATARLEDGSRSLRAGAARLGRGARRVRGGTAGVRDGLGEALAGARRLDRALTRALAGARELTAAAGDLEAGASSLRTGAARDLGRGAAALQAGLEDGAGRLAALARPADEALAAARRSYEALTAMSVGKVDPRYRAAVEAAGETLAALSGADPRDGRRLDEAYAGLPAALATAEARTRAAAAAAGRLAEGAAGVARGAERLQDGVAGLAAGQGRLRAALAAVSAGAPQGEAGLARLRAAGGDLDAGLQALVGGADRLRDGLDRVSAGSARLRERLAGEGRRTLPLLRGAARSDGAIGRLRRAAGATAGLAQAPGLLSSGYVALAALDGARPADRNRSSLFVDVLGGGRAARILAVPAVPPNTPEATALRDRMSALVAALPASRIEDGAVGGVGAELEDFVDRTRSGFPLLMVGISLASVLALMLLLRAALLPVIAVSLNLLTVGVAFGVLVLGFQGADPPLGGPGSIDMIGVVVMFVVIFALSIDYQVFLLARMREGLDATRDPREAIAYAIERTAPVVTGAALIMCAVFVAFAFSDLTLLRQLGVGLTVAVLLDATVIRLVLLPAILRAVGGAAWWMPGRVERRLPALALD